MHAYLEARFGSDEPTAYAWIITVDHLEDDQDDSAVGIMGPRQAPDELLERVQAGEGEEFRLLDDDGELYYEGRVIGPKHYCSDAALDHLVEWEFAPLDQFGKGYAGCTEIQYRDEAGNWKTL